MVSLFYPEYNQYIRNFFFNFKNLQSCNINFSLEILSLDPTLYTPFLSFLRFKTMIFAKVEICNGLKKTFLYK